MCGFYLLICVLIFCKGSYGGQGECCRSYYGGHDLVYRREQYCSNYCCDITYSGGYIERNCCDDWLKETASYNREHGCHDDWWDDNTWAIPVFVIGILVILAGCIVCCVCCVKACTNKTTSSGTVFVQQPQPGGMAMVTASSQQQQQQQIGGGGNGYPPPPPPSNYGVQPASNGNNLNGNQPQPSASDGVFVAPPPYPEKGPM